MKKILLSISMITVVAVAAIGATGAFFSDTETSTGNTFTAGAIDLGIDNHSYYNGVLNPGTTWRVDYDLSKNADGQPEVHQFFNFGDLKPGDWGEDTISLHVKDNDSYLCADVTLTSDNDNGLTEPEGNDGDNTPGPTGQGELADAVDFYWWADDGDNVYEVGENLLPAGPLGNLSVGQTATVALADSQTNIWGDNVSTTHALPGDQVRYIGKAWCFGDSTMTPYTQDNLGGTATNGPDDGRPVVCSGANENNITQTDSMTADITFRAVQSRNNAGFVCSQPQQEPHQLVLENETMVGDPWTPITGDDKQGVLTWTGDGPTFDYTLSATGLPAATPYSLIYYADPFPGNNPGALIGTGTTDGSGNLSFTGNPDLGIDLPTLPDTNIAAHSGAKIWLIPSANYDASTKSVTPWAPNDNWLFEGNVYINYNDTNN